MKKSLLLLSICCFSIATAATGQEEPDPPLDPNPPISPLLPTPDPNSFVPVYDPFTASPPPPKDPVPYEPNRQALFGDVHVHTGYSFDAYNMGVVTLPSDAYRFAKGGEIATPLDVGMQNKRPLDFMAVTDHAEYLGMLRTGFYPLAMDTFIRANFGSLANFLQVSPAGLTTQQWGDIAITQQTKPWYDEPADLSVMQDAWQDIIDTANAENDPGVFTAIVGYEWSSFPNRANMMHRVILWRGDNVPSMLFDSESFPESGWPGSEDPNDLWAQFEAWEAEGYDELISIPHNMNQSQGWSFRRTGFDGVTPMDQTEVDRRLKWEPIYETYQIKGQSEVHPGLSPEDEFADFEVADTILSDTAEPADPTGSYARFGLKLGMEMEADGQVTNPFKFGMIGSSDAHMSNSPSEEDNYKGKFGLLDGSAALRTTRALLIAERDGIGAPQQNIPPPNWGSGALAAVWAEENTRDSIFDALQRKEVYSTSGPHIQLRFFGGFDLPMGLPNQPDPIGKAYEKGVPMGGDLTSRNGNKKPNFFVWAAKDSIGANLDRIQIIKGWVDEDGVAQEKVFNVVASDGRKIKKNEVDPVGNTVDPSVPSYENTIGDAELVGVWKDKDFDRNQKAFYYARALEIPTPRWHTYDAASQGCPLGDPTVDLGGLQLYGGSPIPDLGVPGVVPAFLGTPATPNPLGPKDDFGMSAAPVAGLHSDTGNSDVDPHPGALGNAGERVFSNSRGTCITFMFDEDERMVGVCADLNTQAAELLELDPQTMEVLGSYQEPGGAANGLQPAYVNMDASGSIGFPTRDGRFVRIERTHNPDGTTTFAVTREIDLTPYLGGDTAFAAGTDVDGNVWFTNGCVEGTVIGDCPDDTRFGYIDPAGNGYTFFIADEIIENGIAIADDGVYIATSKQMLAVEADPAGGVNLRWAREYDQGSGFKPGGFARGTGTTVTLLGDDYVSIVDNADDRVNLLAYRRTGPNEGALVCEHPLFQSGKSAVEVSQIAHPLGDGSYGVIVDNSYNGVPAFGGGGSPLDPIYNDWSQVEPGMARIDVLPDDAGCELVWEQYETRTSAVNKLSSENGLIYASTQNTNIAPFGNYVWYVTAIDFQTGDEVFSIRTGAGALKNNNHVGMTLGPDGTIYQGVIGGAVVIRPQEMQCGGLLPLDKPLSIQERAVSSPIWYNP